MKSLLALLAFLSLSASACGGSDKSADGGAGGGGADATTDAADDKFTEEESLVFCDDFVENVASACGWVSDISICLQVYGTQTKACREAFIKSNECLVDAVNNELAADCDKAETVCSDLLDEERAICPN